MLLNPTASQLPAVPIALTLTSQAPGTVTLGLTLVSTPAALNTCCAAAGAVSAPNASASAIAAASGDICAARLRDVQATNGARRWPCRAERLRSPLKRKRNEPASAPLPYAPPSAPQPC